MDIGYILGFMVGLTVFAAAVALLFLIITRGTQAAFGPRRRLEEELGLSALRGRFARGEITQEEFDLAARTIVRSYRPEQRVK